MEERVLVGVIFFILGGVMALRPGLFLHFQVWVQRTLLGAVYTPGQRTYTIVRFIGAFLLLIGVASVTGILEQRGSQQAQPASYLTFCEGLINMKRLVSSSSIVPGIDVLPEEYATGAAAPVHFDGRYPEAAQFRTKIQEAVAGGPNFAGHYTVATWGCGTSCQSYAVVDTMIGDIVSYGLGSEYGALYTLDSKLLVLNPKENFPTLAESGMSRHQAAETFARIPREYYLIVQNEVSHESFLKLFCTESAASHYQ